LLLRINLYIYNVNIIYIMDSSHLKNEIKENLKNKIEQLNEAEWGNTKEGKKIFDELVKLKEEMDINTGFTKEKIQEIRDIVTFNYETSEEGYKKLLINLNNAIKGENETKSGGDDEELKTIKLIDKKISQLDIKKTDQRLIKERLEELKKNIKKIKELQKIQMVVQRTGKSYEFLKLLDKFEEEDDNKDDNEDDNDQEFYQFDENHDAILFINTDNTIIKIPLNMKSMNKKGKKRWTSNSFKLFKDDIKKAIDREANENEESGFELMKMVKMQNLNQAPVVTEIKLYRKNPEGEDFEISEWEDLNKDKTDIFVYLDGPNQYNPNIRTNTDESSRGTISGSSGSSGNENKNNNNNNSNPNNNNSNNDAGEDRCYDIKLMTIDNVDGVFVSGGELCDQSRSEIRGGFKRKKSKKHRKKKLKSKRRLKKIKRKSLRKKKKKKKKKNKKKKKEKVKKISKFLKK
jgi:hypothetical protein